MILKGFVLSVACFLAVGAANLKLANLNFVYEWKTLNFVWPNAQAEQQALSNGSYIPVNNLGLGFIATKDKLFVTLPRWRAGVPATLAYIPRNSTEQSPRLIPYPDWKANTVPKDGEPVAANQIVSAFRGHVDECDRLWLIDNGVDDAMGKHNIVTQPSIVIFDLKTDKLVRKYTLNPRDIDCNSLFTNVIVDVNKDQCDKAFAYVPDVLGYGLVVYSYADNISWRYTHSYFHFNPLEGNMTIHGVNFISIDGGVGLALGPVQADGYRTAYFHALASTDQFSVSTKVLKDNTTTSAYSNLSLMKWEGNKGPLSQSTSPAFDPETNVQFTGEVQRDGIACWNPKTKVQPSNVPLVAQDDRINFISDLSIDSDRTLWAISNTFPEFNNNVQDVNKVNYRISKVPVDDAIEGTACHV